MVRPNGNFCMSVDFGTTNTLVFAKDLGVVVNQASLLALKSETGKSQSYTVLGAGSSVSPLVGRTAPLISVEAPLASGVIRDTELAKLLLHELISEHLPWSRRIPLPHQGRGVLISTPREVTEYERSAFQDAVRSLGFSSVGVVDEPLAAALGSGIPLFAPQGQMLVDLGSGITEAIIMSSGMVVDSNSLREGGNDLDQAIVDHFEQQHRFKIALGHARNIKERFGAVGSAVRDVEIQLQGKCLKSKLPRKKSINAIELSLCLRAYVDRIERLILGLIEKAEPELVSDVLQEGVWLSGGGALLPGLSDELENRLKFSVRVVQDPLGAVIAGNGMIVNEPEYSHLCRIVS